LRDAAIRRDGTGIKDAVTKTNSGFVVKILFNFSMSESTFGFIRRHSVLIIAVTLTITFILGSQLAGLRFENNPGQLDLPPDDPVRRDLDTFGEQFRSGKVMIIGMERSAPILARDLQRIRGLTEKLSAVEGVQSVYSLTNAVDLEWSSSLFMNVLRTRILASPARLKTDTAAVDFVSKMTGNPLYSSNLISADGRHCAFLLTVDPGFENGVSRISRQKQLLNRIRSTTAPYQGDGSVFHFAGPIALNLALQSAMRRDLLMFAPISVLIFLLVLIAIFRSARAILIAVVVAVCSLIWSLGMLPLTGTPMSVGLTMIIPVILSMSLVYAIHYLACFTRYQQDDYTPLSWIGSCFRRIMIPSLLCGITTLLGFLSLGVSPLPGIRDVGIFLGSGIVACVWMANIFLPALALRVTISQRAAKGPVRRDPVDNFADWLREIVTKYPARFVSVVALMTILSALGLNRLSVETNHLEYLKSDKAITESFSFVDRYFGGILPLEIILHVPERGAAEAIRRMSMAQKELRELSGIGTVLSAADLILRAEETKPANNLPMVPAFDLSKNLLSPQTLRSLVPPSIGGLYIVQVDTILALRIACRAHINSSRELNAMIGAVDSIVVSRLNDYSPVVTGLTRYLCAMERYVIRTQIQSFVLALAITMILLGLMGGALRTSIAVVVVNVIPVIVVLGIMGWLGIPLDISTVMIASIAIGIVVDDTMHLLYRYRLGLKAGHSGQDSLTLAFREVGKPIVASTIILAAGFAVLLPAQFAPTAYFGGLSALTILVAGVCDLLLLPALLAIFLRWNRNA